MRWVGLVVVTALMGLLGCTPPEPGLPPVAPPPEDLSTWSVPALEQLPDVPEPPVSLLSEGPPLPEKPTASEKVYDFRPGETYIATVALNTPLDIILETGEKIVNHVEGDRPRLAEGGQDEQSRRWDIQVGGEGLGERFRPHLFVTVTEPGLAQGVVVTTTRRTYYLTCKSVGQSPIRSVRWRYPAPLVSHAAPAPVPQGP